MPVGSPQLISPQTGTFHKIVPIEWLRPEETENITYELEYSLGGDVWHVLKRRIYGEDASYDWVVGKSIKSAHVRVRVRSKSTDESISDWSISSGEFSINVYDVEAPRILSPVSKHSYKDSVLVILDSSNQQNSFHEKVTYRLEYSSEALEIDWTEIVSDVPISQTLTRWDISSFIPSDDYQLRLTVLDAMDLASSSQRNQSYVKNLYLGSSGLFILDTIGPEAVLATESVTNVSDLPLTIYAHDATTGLGKMQIRQCPTLSLISLGALSSSEETSEECESFVSILGNNPTATDAFGKSVDFAPKTLVSMTGTDGHKKIEALLFDQAGNLSVADKKTFLSLLLSDSIINDWLLRIETRETPNQAEEKYEILYAGTEDGVLWELDPFPHQLTTIDNFSIKRISDFDDSIYISAFSSSLDRSEIYRLVVVSPVLIHRFSSANAEVAATAVFDDELYFGLVNGELWKYDLTSFTLVSTFDTSISNLYADNHYLYLGFYRDTAIILYDGSDFFD